MVAIDAEDLTPGDVYEGWLAYVAAPVACAAVPCPLSDLVRPEPPGILTRLEVAVAGNTRRARFAGTFRGLTVAKGSQIQLLLLAHGPEIVGDGHVHQLLAPAGGVVIARTHFTVRGWAGSFD